MTKLNHLNTLIAIMALSSLLAFSVGCGVADPMDAVAKNNDSNIKCLANLYSKYQSAHGWMGPDSEDAFSDFVKNDVPDFIKKRMGIEDVDALFISQRDGQPFKIRLEVAGSSRGCNEPAIFESEGVSGKRMVAFLNMMQREVDESEYSDLWEGKFKPADLLPSS